MTGCSSGAACGRPGRPGSGRASSSWPGTRTGAGFLLVKRAVRRTGQGWWLESDNRGVGEVDSRSFGAVPDGLIEGRVLWRYRRFRG